MRARWDHEVTSKISKAELSRALELSKHPPPPHDDFDEEESPIKGLSERAARVGAVLVTGFVTLGAGLMILMLVA